MARGLLSHRVATLAAVAACLVILDGQAAATAPQQPCEAEEGGHCPSAADELDEASLLMRGAATKAHDHSAVAAAGDANATAKCNEIKFQGLCYRTCTDMGAMEPRRSPSNCGGVNDYNFIQRCNEDGSSTGGSGSAPGLSGRPKGGCFGDDSASLPSKKAPNMCTMDCKRGAPSTKAEGCKAKLCCSDGKSEPQALKLDKDLICSCPLGKPAPMPWLPKPNGVLTTPALKPCNTVCNNAKNWLMVDNIAYCCPQDKQPTVKRQLGGGGDYSMKCSCP